MQNLTRQRALAIFEQNRDNDRLCDRTNEYGCLLDLRAHNGRRRCQWSIDGHKYLNYIVAVYGVTGELWGQNRYSHLCHNPNCFHPGHLLDESMENNEDRKGCVDRVSIACPHCEARILLCQHNPPCLDKLQFRNLPVHPLNAHVAPVAPVAQVAQVVPVAQVAPVEVIDLVSEASSVVEEMDLVSEASSVTEVVSDDSSVTEVVEDDEDEEGEPQVTMAGLAYALAFAWD